MSVGYLLARSLCPAVTLDTSFATADLSGRYAKGESHYVTRLLPFVRYIY